MSFFGLGLSALVVVATAMVLLPLARQQGISQRLLLAVGLLVPILALSLYGLLGNPQAVSRHATPANQTPEMSGLIGSLEQRLQAQPDDLDGWLLLANSYLANQQLAQAQGAFEQAHRLAPEDTGITLSLIDILSTQQSGLFLTDADRLIAQVLALEPDNALALWFAGLSAQQKGNNVQAAEIFKKMKTVLPKDAPVTQHILEALPQAQN
jgi:cytochrome c-type biogenesis protein CcmH